MINSGCMLQVTVYLDANSTVVLFFGKKGNFLSEKVTI